MPLLSTGLKSQESAASAGFRTYPQLSGVTKHGTFLDQFNRTTLNPSGSYPYYTTSAQGTGGSVTINAGNNLQLTSGSTALDFAKCTTDELLFERGGVGFQDTTQINFEIFFQWNLGISASEMFIGLINVADTDDVLPSTAVHCGLELDSSASGALFFTSGNGSAQTTTATGITPSTTFTPRRLRINWISQDSLTMEVTDTDLTTTLASTTVTDINSASTLKVKFIMVSEGAANESLGIPQWGFTGA